MKRYLLSLLLMVLPTISLAEWLADNSPIPEFEIYRYPDSTYHTSEDVTGKVVLYVFGSIT